MSQIASGAHSHDHAGGHGHAAGHAHSHGVNPSLLTRENTHMPESWGKGLFGVLALVGLLGCGLTAAYPYIDTSEGAAKHAMASYHVGFVVSLTLMLGSLAYVLIMHLTKAGWSVPIRRQAENVAALMPLGILLAIPVVVFGPKLFKWMNPALNDAASPMFDAILHEKASYLSTNFFYVRLGVYFLIWTYLALRLRGWSRQQDVTGDKSLTTRAGTTSAWGILAFALSLAFAGMDLVMSLDYHWFSTMFGVYIFAGSILSGVALLIILMTIIRSSGRLNGLLSKEHFHDQGKLLFAFMVFWAYIGFSQYFLLWYANIPEETAWINARGAGVFTDSAWKPVFLLLCFGHFLAPFPILLFRKVKRTPMLASLFAAWLIAMHCVDMFWLIRPITSPDTYALAVDGTVTLATSSLGLAWVDATGLLGPLCLTLAGAVHLMRTSPLIPLKDPRLIEAAEHKNYV